MQDEIKNNIRSVLTEVKEIFDSKRIVASEFKRLSNSLMEDVSLFRNQDSISLAVLVYSLYRIFNKNRDLDKKQLLKLIEKTIKSIDIEPQFRYNLRRMFDLIKKYDKNIDTKIVQIISQAHIKKGLKVYEHGLSIGQAAEIIGVSKWDLMDYLGTSNLVDRDENRRIDHKTRLNYARGLFK